MRITRYLLLLFFPLMAFPSFADSISGDWQYILNNENRAIVTRYTGSAAEVQMPWNLNGYIIGEIGEGAFAGNTQLRSIKLPVGLTIIRMNAFHGCTELKEIVLPSLLETIEDSAFANCSSLLSIEIPDSVAEIGDGVFDSSIILRGSSSSLAPHYAAACDLQYFDSADSINSSVTDNNPAQRFQYQIRNGGVVITSYIADDYEVIVPADIDGYPVRAIGTSAFSSRYEVERVILPEGLIELERTAFRKCTSLSYIELPSTLLYIRDNAFYQCENLEEIVIPASVLELGDRAFTGCSQLKRVTIHANLNSIRTYTFYDCHPALTIYAPKGSVAERHAHARGYRFVEIN